MLLYATCRIQKLAARTVFDVVQYILCWQYSVHASLRNFISLTDESIFTNIYFMLKTIVINFIISSGLERGL